MIQVSRRRLLDAALALRDAKVAPPGAQNPELYSLVAGGFFLTAAGRHLAEVYAEQLDSRAIARQAAAWHGNGISSAY